MEIRRGIMSRCNGDDGHLPTGQKIPSGKENEPLSRGEACNNVPFTDTSLTALYRYLDGRHAKCHAARPATIRLVRLPALTLGSEAGPRYSWPNEWPSVYLASDDESRCIGGNPEIGPPQVQR
ncbi:hypothetical protein K0M31_018679 [Melipona bicolor]|uniref:Uncharacterized protein n=1 Tax=Melipona bicolor TaxID=60889 RepID=A0AA40KRX3_9HYME|nr:hypothetical protein K0M31_018679 [Melipona bicolor]